MCCRARPCLCPQSRPHKGPLIPGAGLAVYRPTQKSGGSRGVVVGGCPTLGAHAASQLGENDPRAAPANCHLSSTSLCLLQWSLLLEPPPFFLTYLAAQGLSCGTQDICCHRQDLQLWRVNSSSQTKPRTCAPLRWKHAVLTTGPPGKSLAPFSYQQLQRALRA